MKSSGSADLPLHNGRVPDWLSERMTKLGTAIVEAIVIQYGRTEVLKRLSDPYWFQAFGAVIGMDWHSSGVTTTVMSALKRGLNPRAGELGIYVCGGRGKFSRMTPDEILRISDRHGLDGDYLTRCSRLSAKVDNTAVQDGFQLYLHAFVLTVDGEWAVIQQGMNPALKLARRYHWHSPLIRSFTEDPHSAIAGPNVGQILNLADGRAVPAQQGIIELLHEAPGVVEKEIRHLVMPSHEQVTPLDVNSKRLGAVLAAAQSLRPASFADALLIPGMGPRTLQSLALVSEVIHGHSARFDDPARFAFAFGGKDRKPFPVATKVYDSAVAELEMAIDKARLGDKDRLESFRRLHAYCRFIEDRFEPEADVEAVITNELENSVSLGGRSVFGWEKDIRKRQLSLFPPAAKRIKQR